MQNEKKYIQQLSFSIVPIIFVSKIIRYTIMYERLVVPGIGWSFVKDISKGNHHFVFNLFEDVGNAANTNTIAFSELINNFVCLSTYYEWEFLITIVFNILLYKTIVSFYKKKIFISKLENFFIYLNIFILNIFCFCLAKEFFQMLFWFLIMYAMKDEVSIYRGIAKVALALCVTVLFTRKYYGLVFFYFIIVHFSVNKFLMQKQFGCKISKFKVFAGLLVILSLMAGMYFLISSFMMMEIKESYDELERVNTTDRSGGAATVIVPIVGGGSAAMLTLEFFIKIFRLMFPVELLLHFKPTYLITIVFQGLVFYILFNALKNRANKSNETILATDLYIAFWLTSAAFEPDFGSWVRHQGVVLPIMLYMLGNNHYKLSRI